MDAMVFIPVVPSIQVVSRLRSVLLVGLGVAVLIGWMVSAASADAHLAGS